MNTTTTKCEPVWGPYNDLLCIGKPHDVYQGESPDDYLWSNEIRHFSFAETLQLKRAGLRASPPPREWLPRIVPALWFAEALRASLSDAYGKEVPITIGNGFRPSPRHPELRGYADLNKRVGGARNSKHITYRALDLDPPKWVKIDDVRAHAMRIYESVVDHTTIGMGFYKYSRRVHVDVGPNEMRSFMDRIRDALWGPTKKYRNMGAEIR